MYLCLRAGYCCIFSEVFFPHNFFRSLIPFYTALLPTIAVALYCSCCCRGSVYEILVRVMRLYDCNQEFHDTANTGVFNKNNKQRTKEKSKNLHEIILVSEKRPGTKGPRRQNWTRPNCTGTQNRTKEPTRKSQTNKTRQPLTGGKGMRRGGTGEHSQMITKKAEGRGRGKYEKRKYKAGNRISKIRKQEHKRDNLRSEDAHL